MDERIILVDEQDNPIGTQEKLAAHKEGALHRCFSIVIFNSKGEILLHKRASSKYHCGGLWTNACCSHQRPGEKTLDAAHRRLEEEMGFDCPLDKVFEFTYRAEFDNGLTEHEYDHVLIGTYDGQVSPEPKEVDEYKWIGQEEYYSEIQESPSEHTVWSIILMQKVKEKGLLPEQQ